MNHILTDPPYNVGVNYGEATNDNKDRAGFIEWMKPRFLEMRKIAKTVLICGQGRLPDYAVIEPRMAEKTATAQLNR